MTDYQTVVGEVMECTACDNGGSGGIHNHAKEDCPFSCCSDTYREPQDRFQQALEWLDSRDWPRVNRALGRGLLVCYSALGALFILDLILLVLGR